MTAIALTIAGSDSGGGAGVQADLKTFSALGVYGASAITALTAQNTCGVQAIHQVPADFVAKQIQSVMSDINVNAIKIGMLASSAIIDAVADALKPYPDIPVVLDPVMVAASGDPLLEASAMDSLRERLLPLAVVVTPNLPEAAMLLGRSIAGTDDEILLQGNDILALGAKTVLIKGGHGLGAQSTDFLIAPQGVIRFSVPRIKTENVHGTGCTLSSAIAAGLAKGLPLLQAVEEAKNYITKAIAASAKLKVGHGHGPAHHFHAWW
jgi:hydroxymethylpyrimidine/phosphomethylpyrimidine kinase